METSDDVNAKEFKKNKNKQTNTQRARHFTAGKTLAAERANRLTATTTQNDGRGRGTRGPKDNADNHAITRSMSGVELPRAIM